MQVKKADAENFPSARSITVDTHRAARPTTAPSERILLVACFGGDDPQFRGLRGAMDELSAVRGFTAICWEDGPLRLARRRAAGVILSGHGSEERARLGDGTSSFVVPGSLRIPHGARLYLLGCYQGRTDLREQWAKGTGLPLEQVRGAEGETETLLSTLFLLHLAERGPLAAEELFDRWEQANRIVRPLFSEARALYARTGGDPLAVLDWLERAADMRPAAPFLALARRRPELLSGILKDK